MRVKDIIDEDFSNYKRPSMLIGTCFCNWKCCDDMKKDRSICQNSTFAKYPIVEMKDSKIVERYLDNPITHSIVFGGLEPIEQFDEMLDLIKEFRSRTDDDIVIYTGFYENEIQEQIECLKGFKNVIVKFGRFKMNGNKHLDEILGVELANEEQYARRIS